MSEVLTTHAIRVLSRAPAHVQNFALLEKSLETPALNNLCRKGGFHKYETSTVDASNSKYFA